MKIAFDAKRVTHNSTGLGNYSRYIINILSSFYPTNTYQLYTPDKGKESLRKRIVNTQFITYHYPSNCISRLFKSWWRSSLIVSDLKKELPVIFHGLSNELPFGLKKNNIKSIVTIHDLIFLRYPQYYKLIDRLIYKLKFKRACMQADKVIAISETTKQDIVNYLSINPDKIEVVYQGCDHAFMENVSAEKKEAIKQKYQLPQNYILCVGSIESRKNLLLIVKALQHIKSDIQLIGIGKKTAYTALVKEYIKQHHLESRVRLLHSIPFDELPAFYQMASIFVYPSFFEGFGIPIIEALHSNIPVIAAKGSCLEEAGGKHSIYINPLDEKELALEIDKLMNNPELVNQMKQEGKKYVQQFSDENIARKLMLIYSKLGIQSK